MTQGKPKREQERERERERKRASDKEREREGEKRRCVKIWKLWRVEEVRVYDEQM